MIETVWNGLCMAVADSVPGVSGGTIAFILGFYDRFINALHSVFSKNSAARKEALVYLFKLGLGWCVGMGVCVFLLTSLFTQHIYFMSSLFLGLTAASIPYMMQAEHAVLSGKGKNFPFALLGVLIVVALSMLRNTAGTFAVIHFAHLAPLQLVYIFLTGMVAITAMVLPGISGSTVLLIAGVYLPAITAIKAFLSFQIAVVPGLMALGLGIVTGIALSIHFIRSALEKHRSKMVYFIIGLMVGSLYAIVMGPTTLASPVAALSVATFSIPGFIIGIGVLFGLEYLRKYMEKRAGIREPEAE